MGVGTRSRSSRLRDGLFNEGGSVNVDPEDDESGEGSARFESRLSKVRQASISSTSPVSDSLSDLVSDNRAKELGSIDFLRTPEGGLGISPRLSLVDCRLPRASEMATPSGLRIFLD